MVLNIAIDGPAGAGKSTVAKGIASALNIAYLDTGAMYRAVAYFCKEIGVAVDSPRQVVPVLDKIDLSIVPSGQAQKVVLNGKDVTGLIRTGEMSMNASTVSKIPEVRIKMVELQRAIAKKSPCVLDGRDIGTFVLPDAPYKFYLTADEKIRAERRYEELLQKGEKPDFDEILKGVIARDKQDMSRDFAPLKQADDAILIDSSHITAEEVINLILAKIV